MTPTRRSFFAALAALVVAPKLKPYRVADMVPSASAEWAWDDFAYTPRKFRYDDHETHLRTHLEDLQATPPRGSTHLERANRIAWRRHLREHELSVQGLMSMRDGRSAFWA